MTEKEARPISERVWKKFFDAGAYKELDKLGQTGMAKKMKVSRMTVWSIQQASRREAAKKPVEEMKYYERMEDTEGWKEYERLYKGKLHGKQAEQSWQGKKRKMARMFAMLNKKPLENWEKLDYEKIWQALKHPKLGGVSEHDASPFHNLMKATNKGALLPLFAGVKHVKGKKKDFYLNEDDVFKMIEAHPIQDGKNDMLLLIGVGCSKGARISSLLLDTPSHYNFEDGTSSDFEPKAGRHEKGGAVLRYLPLSVTNLVKKYVEDCKIEASERIFPDSYTNYLDRLQMLGHKAGIQKFKREEGIDIPIEVGTHIFKHTFVTQASRHGVPAETIGRQAHTELRTLEAHYMADDPEKSQHFLQGKPEKEHRQSFEEWINQFMPKIQVAYEKNCSSDARCKRKTI